jgi:hypothetical protein
LTQASLDATKRILSFRGEETASGSSTFVQAAWRETHALVVPDDVKEMATMFHVTGALGGFFIGR